MSKADDPGAPTDHMWAPPEDWAPRRGPRRNLQWRTVSHGLHRPVAQQASPHGDLDAWQLVLPQSGVFTHLTAAGVFGWWQPPLPAGLPVFASQSRDDPRPRRPGLRVARHPEPPAHILRDGLRLASPEEVLLACARDLGVLDVVVLLDAALRCGDCDLPTVVAVAQGRPGAPVLRRAAALADPRAESPWETLLRLLHVVCDVPVVPQHELYDQGRFVARGDLWLEGTRVFHEYDGGDHLLRAQQRKDLRRARAVSNSNWVRRGYTAVEVVQQAHVIIRDADLSLGRPHRPERVRRWYGLLGESLFTPRGTARVLHRWNIRP